MPLRGTLNDENKLWLLCLWVVPDGCWVAGRITVVLLSPSISLTRTVCCEPSIVALALARNTRSSLVAFCAVPRLPTGCLEVRFFTISDYVRGRGLCANRQ